METFKMVVQTGSFFLFILLALLMIVAFSNIVKLNKKINRLKRRYDNILRGKGEMDIEEVLLSYGKDLDDIKNDVDSIMSIQERIKKDISLSVKKVGIHNYDSFPELKNKLSYTLVLLDSENNGFMITSIYGRESSVSFSKTVKNGTVKVNISDDEKIALNKALGT